LVQLSSAHALLCVSTLKQEHTKHDYISQKQNN